MLQIYSSKKWIKRSIALSFIAAIVGQAKSSYAINFTFDYTYDNTNKFFDSSTTLGQSRRATLEAAADYFEPFTDQLSAITPDENNSWTAYFTNPQTGDENEPVNNLTIPDNTLVIYVGARDLLSGIGEGGPGGYDYSAVDPDFADAIETRGQSANDFGTWGGSISFDNQVNWNSGTNPPSNSTDNDLLSVAIHELGHLMGIGTADSWNNKISGSNFTGANSIAAYKGNVPLYDTGHWEENTMSTVNGVSQEAAMDPNLTVGTRKLFTQLDYAGLKDVGWQTQSVPFEFSPGLGIVLVGGLYGLSKAKAALKK